MIDINILKSYLRIDFEDDNDILNNFFLTADLYLQGAITNWNKIKENEKYKDKVIILYCAVIQDLYDNRGTKTSEIRENRIIQSLIQQLDLVILND